MVALGCGSLAVARWLEWYFLAILVIVAKSNDVDKSDLASNEHVALSYYLGLTLELYLCQEVPGEDHTW